MLPFLKKISASLITPISWTLVTIILLCIPGSSFPGEGFLFKIPHFDKVVHVILFGGMVVLWAFYFFLKNPQMQHWHLTIATIVLLAITIGVCMEHVQLRFVPNRAFDKGDIIANTISSLIFGTMFMFKDHAIKFRRKK
jgi:VanZ family protein